MLGKWKMKYLATFDPEACEMKRLTVDEVLAMPDGEEKEELMEMAHAVMEITETSLRILIPIPADQVEEAKAAGAPVTEDGFVITQQSAVKVEDGVYYYDAEMRGEIMGQEIDSWMPLACDEAGDLSLNPMMTFGKM